MDEDGRVRVRKGYLGVLIRRFVVGERADVVALFPLHAPAA